MNRFELNPDAKEISADLEVNEDGYLELYIDGFLALSIEPEHGKIHLVDGLTALFEKYHWYLDEAGRLVLADFPKVEEKSS